MNNKVCRLILMNILFLILSSIIFPQNQPKAWYVYKYATGLNNGTSWANAWTSFASINWNNVLPGDTVYISGGTDSLIYTEQLTISGKDGLPNQYIVITKGNDAGHNGKVIINGGYSIGEVVRILGSKYIKLSKIKVTYGSIVVFDLYNSVSSRHIIIDSVEVYNHSGGGIALGGYPTPGLIDSVFITNSRIVRDSTYNAQTDNISIGYGTNIFIRNNYLYLYNNSDGHNDNIQAYQTNYNIEISGNYIEHIQPTNPITGWADNVIFLNYVRGWVKFFNNVLNYQTATGWFNIFGHGVENAADYGETHIYNNTFIGGTSGTNVICLIPSTADSFYLQNNIFYSTAASNTQLFTLPSTVPASQCKNNLYYNPNSQSFYKIGSNTYTIPQLQSLGYEQGSIFGVPQFVDFTNKDYRLQSSSPARNAGVNLSSFFTIDKEGNPRPVGGAWDIGAYEFYEGQTQDDIPPEVVSAAILDSVTLRIIFSEPLEQSNAVNPANYQIDNGVTVNNVELISNSVVKLNTTIHSPGFYTVTVSNVTDTAGNFITNQNNTANYGYNPDPLPGLLKFTPSGALASSIPEPQHLPEKTFDGLGYNSGDPSSRWAAQGLPQWIVYDLGDVRMVNKTRIQYFRWLEGRIYTYSILSSVDSINWTMIRQNIQSQNVEWNEENFEPIPARYVKILVTGNNESDWANIWETEIYGQLVVSGNEDNNIKPDDFALEQNYPNPFNPVTKIRYSIPGDVETRRGVSLRVFDILGNEVATLVDEYKKPGRYEVEFNASDLASGVYVYRLQTDRYISTKKMILLR